LEIDMKGALRRNETSIPTDALGIVWAISAVALRMSKTLKRG
jgi:hypothetical protein